MLSSMELKFHQVTGRCSRTMLELQNHHHNGHAVRYKFQANSNLYAVNPNCEALAPGTWVTIQFATRRRITAGIGAAMDEHQFRLIAECDVCRRKQILMLPVRACLEVILPQAPTLPESSSSSAFACASSPSSPSPPAATPTATASLIVDTPATVPTSPVGPERAGQFPVAPSMLDPSAPASGTFSNDTLMLQWAAGPRSRSPSLITTVLDVLEDPDSANDANEARPPLKAAKTTTENDSMPRQTGCQRISIADGATQVGRSDAAIVDSAIECLREINCSGNIGYIGVTQDMLRRFHFMDPWEPAAWDAEHMHLRSSHFPRFRSMLAVALAPNGASARRLECKLLKTARQFNLRISNSASSEGGERVDAADNVQRWVYILSTAGPTDCSCMPCSQWMEHLAPYLTTASDDKTTPAA